MQEKEVIFVNSGDPALVGGVTSNIIYQDGGRSGSRRGS